jgi:arginine exporter protein ArgO
MLSKAIYFVGGTIAMSLVWLFALIWIAGACCNVTLEGLPLLGVGSACAGLAAVAAWRLFVKPAK